MNAYQQKWVEMLQKANLQGWTVKAIDDDIYIDMPSVTDLKLIRDNVPQTLGLMSLDITLPKTRVKFIFHNGYENFEYVLNPGSADLEEDND